MIAAAHLRPGDLIPDAGVVRRVEARSTLPNTHTYLALDESSLTLGGTTGLRAAIARIDPDADEDMAYYMPSNADRLVAPNGVLIEVQR
jgi:hypothetical protein